MGSIYHSRCTHSSLDNDHLSPNAYRRDNGIHYLIPIGEETMIDILFTGLIAVISFCIGWFAAWGFGAFKQYKEVCRVCEKR